MTIAPTKIKREISLNEEEKDVISKASKFLYDLLNLEGRSGEGFKFIISNYNCELSSKEIEKCLSILQDIKYIDAYEYLFPSEDVEPELI